MSYQRGLLLGGLLGVLLYVGLGFYQGSLTGMGAATILLLALLIVLLAFSIRRRQ